MKLKEVIDLWLPEKKRQVKESTFSAYSLTCSRIIIPAFGEMDVSSIDKIAVRSFAYRELESKSAKTVKDILIVLKMLMNYAAEELDQSIPSLTWKIVWPSSNLDNHKIERYSQKQVKSIIDHIMANPGNTSLAVLIALTTGMRIGEICALRFSDIDLDKGVIHITKTVERVATLSGMESNSKMETRLIESTPKTKNSRRDVPLTPKLKKMLKAFDAVSKPEYYVTSGSVRCCEPRTFRNQAARLIEASGVSPVLKFHALRHTFASTLIENHIDPKTVSSILGHSDVSITLNLYVHPSDKAKADAISKGLRGLL